MNELIPLIRSTIEMLYRMAEEGLPETSQELPCSVEAFCRAEDLERLLDQVVPLLSDLADEYHQASIFCERVLKECRAGRLPLAPA